MHPGNMSLYENDIEGIETNKPDVDNFNATDCYLDVDLKFVEMREIMYTSDCATLIRK